MDPFPGHADPGVFRVYAYAHLSAAGETINR